MIRSRSLIVLLACLFTTSLSPAPDPDPKNPKDPKPAALFSGLVVGDIIRSSYLRTSANIIEGTKTLRVSLQLGAQDKHTLTLDPNTVIFDAYGDEAGSTEIAERRIVVSLKKVALDDPNKQGRQLHEVEGENLKGRLFLAFAPKAYSPYKLIVKNKDGKIETVIPLYVQPKNIEPCHPGCFPTGTLVETPDGAKKIETLQPGDEVLNISIDNKSTPIKIASVFKGQAPIIEIDTDQGIVRTTCKQPMILVNGDFRAAGELRTGDQIARWNANKADSAKVIAVRQTDKIEKIFNLVLEERGTFVANGYLARSKPPIE
jgi:hypothetical protein